jgi:hypothetical protein
LARLSFFFFKRGHQNIFSTGLLLLFNLTDLSIAISVPRVEAFIMAIKFLKEIGNVKHCRMFTSFSVKVAIDRVP